MREEKLAELFGQAIKQLHMTDDDLQWLLVALKEGHQEVTAFHKERVASLQERYNRLTNRIEAIYEDKLDGKIPVELWFRKHEQYKQELVEVEASLAQHTKGNLDYVESGVQLLELAKNAYPPKTEKANFPKSDGTAADVEFLVPEHFFERRKPKRGLEKTV